MIVEFLDTGSKMLSMCFIKSCVCGGVVIVQMKNAFMFSIKVVNPFYVQQY